MTDDESPLSAEARIRRLLQDRARAVRAGDVDGVVAALARDVSTFDVLPPLRTAGADGVRERAERWLDGYRGAPRYEMRDLAVVAGNDVAFAHYLYHVSGTLKGGGEVGMWVRATVGLRRLDREWKIVHQHDSVPFDGESGRARLDLEP